MLPWNHPSFRRAAPRSQAWMVQLATCVCVCMHACAPLRVPVLCLTRVPAECAI